MRGTGVACAWDHPFRALPPGGPSRIASGDTLVIGPGSYRMGVGAPGDDGCHPDWSYDCHMSAVPAGAAPDEPTRIVGAGWDDGCTDPPELWGAERPWFVLDLSGSSDVEVRCLEITDHASCIEHHHDPASRCERDAAPFGDWAPVGIHAEDAARVTLADLDVHGLAAIGIHAGRLTDWTVDRVRIAANGWAGWDGDLWSGDDGNDGQLLFRQVEVAFNGCAEWWSDGTLLPSSCWAQSAGGYGDGFAAGASGGDWVFERCRVHHNTSDGIDLLYLEPGANVAVDRLWAAGNAGNQLKMSAPGSVVNSVLVGDCAFFETFGGSVDPCRAAGNTLALDLHRGDVVTVTNTTIAGEGDCLVEASCNDAEPGNSLPDCDGSESASFVNSLLLGGVDFFQPWQRTCLAWWDAGALPADPVTWDHVLVHDCEGDPCPPGSTVCADPDLRNPSLDTFDGHLLPSSPAVDAGEPAAAPAVDHDGRPRDPLPDIGAYELVDLVFADGFESGNTSAWSQATPPER